MNIALHWMTCATSPGGPEESHRRPLAVGEVGAAHRARLGHWRARERGCNGMQWHTIVCIHVCVYTCASVYCQCEYVKYVYMYMYIVRVIYVCICT